MRASLAFFLTNLDDDILFVSSSRSAGFFQNVDETRRMGMEANAQGRWRFLTYFLSYSFTRATFESTVSFPSAAGDDVARPGDTLPGVPRHLFKSGFDAELPLGFRLGADLQLTSRQFLRGDEANQREPIPSYTVVNARLSYTYGHVTLFARAENLFDTEYETFGAFAENPLAGGRVERFLSPGPPLGGWFGVRVEL
jgi:outer membrane receptor protein involved in Fe transport